MTGKFREKSKLMYTRLSKRIWHLLYALFLKNQASSHLAHTHRSEGDDFAS